MGPVLNIHPPESYAKERLAHIDSLRALAALAVVFHHLGGDLVTRLGFDFGRYGVLVFFIISGYVVPHSLLTRTERPLAAFALSRVFRLYPAYWFSLALAVALADNAVTALPLAANLTMAQRFLGIADLLGAYWTLAVELAFYLGCAVLFIAGMLDRLDRLLALLAALTAATLAGAVLRAGFGWPLPFAWLGFFSLMVGGTVLRRLDDGGHDDDRRILPAVALFLAFHLSALIAIYLDPGHERPASREVAAWVAAVVSFLVFRRLQLAPPGTAYVGRISYSLYLLHVPISGMVVSVLPPLFAAPIAFMACLAAAAAAFHFIEQPAMRMGRRFAAGLALRPGRP